MVDWSPVLELFNIYLLNTYYVLGPLLGHFFYINSVILFTVAESECGLNRFLQLMEQIYIPRSLLPFGKDGLN